jgi:phosphoglycolate phosphatase
MDDAAFLFGLIAHVCKEQALAAKDDSFHVEGAAFFVRVECFGFLVKGLLVRVRTVDEQRNPVRVAQASATVGFVLRRLGQAIGGSAGVPRAQPFALRLFQGLPDAAQRSLPGTAPRYWWGNDSLDRAAEVKLAGAAYLFSYGTAWRIAPCWMTSPPAPLTIGLIDRWEVKERMDGIAASGNGKFAGVRALVFDLDGTLIDSKLDLALSIDATLQYLGRASLPHETIYSYVGNGAAVLVRRALGDSVTDAEAEEGHRFFLAFYREHMLDNTITYPGVREALEMLGDRPMAVLTNKPVRFSKRILEGLGITKYFRYVYGGNSFETKKPDPEGMKVILRDLAVAPRAAMLVGDSDVDVRTARNAGTWACGVSYGLGFESMRAHPPDLMLDNLAELPVRLNGRCE